MANGLNLEVAHAVVYVCDMDRMIDFYGRVLGFEVTDRGPLGRPGADAEIVFLSQAANHHHQLAFVNMRKEAGKSNNVDHVAFRSSGTIDDLRQLKSTLEVEDGVTAIRPLTHGNAWSVYFQDPEGNGVEIFIDSPWHVAQPQGKPLDLDRPTEEIVNWTVETFRTEPGFGPIEEFYDRRKQHLAQR